MRKLVIVITILAITGIARAATVQVTWNPNTEEDLAGYRLYYGAASGQYGEPVDVANVTEHLVEITPQYGATYYFALTAYDTSGNESEFSNEATCFVPDGSAPAKPKGVIARIIEAVVSWIRGLFGLRTTVV